MGTVVWHFRLALALAAQAQGILVDLNLTESLETPGSSA
jgi:hypothetical protein